MVGADFPVSGNSSSGSSSEASSRATALLAGSQNSGCDTNRFRCHSAQPILVSVEASNETPKELTDSAPDPAGVAESSFFCFGFAFAKELKMLFFSFFGAVCSACLADVCVSSAFGVSLGCDGDFVSVSSSFFISLVCAGCSFCKGRLAGTVLLDGTGCEGRAVGGPVLRCGR